MRYKIPYIVFSISTELSVTYMKFLSFFLVVILFFSKSIYKTVVTKLWDMYIFLELYPLCYNAEVLVKEIYRKYRKYLKTPK